MLVKETDELAIWGTLSRKARQGRRRGTRHHDATSKPQGCARSALNVGFGGTFGDATRGILYLHLLDPYNYLGALVRPYAVQVWRGEKSVGKSHPRLAGWIFYFEWAIFEKAIVLNSIKPKCWVWEENDNC